MKRPQFVSRAKITFEQNTWDVYNLFDVHDELLEQEGVIRTEGKASVLVRSTFLFITACWESYVEDLCEEALSSLSTSAFKGKKWAGTVLKNQARDLLSDFNTPKSGNVDTVFARTIGLQKLSKCWEWNGMSADQARSTLGNYVTARGAIAHRARTSHPISRKGAEQYLDFVKTLVANTERRIQIYVRRITGIHFGKKSRR